MSSPCTEGLHPKAVGLDARDPVEVAQILLDAQTDALNAVAAATSDIADASALMARAVRNGGALVYAAAGSSGLMALADAAELEATFGIAASRIAIHMAGGIPQSAHMPGATEDDAAAAHRAAAELNAQDAVIALSASGSTPFPLAFLQQARARGASTIAIANNPGAPLFECADVAILLATPPEVIAGSTRMGAGTAQKAALNMMSSLMGIALGHVHDGMMVNVRADNAKLRDRASRIVTTITGVTEAQAAASLDATDGSVKAAVLHAAGVPPQNTSAALAAADGKLRTALEQL